MIEGMAILSHAEDDSKFVSRWMEQGDIEDLKMLEDKESGNFPVSEKQKVHIRQRVNKLQHLLKKRAKKDIKQKKREPKYDDYGTHKIPMKKFVKELSKEADYWNDVYSVYDRFSKWQHWSPAGISQFVKITGDELSFIEDYTLRPITLTYGIFCLTQTSKIFNQKFSLGKEQELSDIETQTVSIFKKFTKKR
ncbi:MAG: hypothetical protein DHS20C02_20140 [Micavibrio sp.]|nr:MAG: hypothetical protein DHS20C02_20140 [Micavibrio sp.]